jgi:ribosomal protein S18 acetylase RimI-like enzyme
VAGEGYGSRRHTVAMPPGPRVRRATVEDAAEAAGLMHRFNSEYDEPIDDPGVLERRYRDQIESGDVTVILAEDSAGFAQLRYRGQIYSEAPAAYLEELYVVPDRRGESLGRALLEAAMEEARSHGADIIDLGTSEDDTAARGLYESAGFTNREGRPDGPVMLYYERDL